MLLLLDRTNVVVARVVSDSGKQLELSYTEQKRHVAASDFEGVTWHTVSSTHEAQVTSWSQSVVPMSWAHRHCDSVARYLQPSPMACTRVTETGSDTVVERIVSKDVFSGVSLAVQSGNEYFDCLFCDQVRHGTSDQMSVHWDFHFEGSRVACGGCDRWFSSLSEWKGHLDEADEEAQEKRSQRNGRSASTRTRCARKRQRLCSAQTSNAEETMTCSWNSANVLCCCGMLFVSCAAFEIHARTPCIPRDRSAPVVTLESSTLESSTATADSTVPGNARSVTNSPLQASSVAGASANVLRFSTTAKVIKDIFGCWGTADSNLVVQFIHACPELKELKDEIRRQFKDMVHEEAPMEIAGVEEQAVLHSGSPDIDTLALCVSNVLAEFLDGTAWCEQMRRLCATASGAAFVDFLRAKLAHNNAVATVAQLEQKMDEARRVMMTYD